MDQSPQFPPSLDFLKAQDSFARFRRALRLSDQSALDDLFSAASQHLAAADLAERALPFELMLVCMLLEQRKEIRRLNAVIEAFHFPDPGLHPERVGLEGTGEPPDRKT